jgi:signal transduction histidine kinase
VGALVCVALVGWFVAGRLLRRRRPTNIVTFTERVRSKAEGLSGHTSRVQERADIAASVDPDRMTQALLQLAANAAPHGSPGGVIGIGSATEVDAGTAGGGSSGRAAAGSGLG